ncbi:MAG: transcription elongation factor GreA [Dehalococcoidales bacterium]|jgi:transcription elongation factor GreA|nr:transcription elongation factor GreA [Dehalococcoidales bacterium]MDD3264990.1 transcription elongation factor GreA [Dehalococcoidales bacterium]MDD4322365.1 transcription elongation factor GreA [Dehalococcoidales bacterium]MDD4794696.1 transcription elongation factor GreA [Dehalococcoidales bacterium]MDD5498271.1 transcription elongation factor GreA [Dehalococcoidales bacterium]
MTAKEAQPALAEVANRFLLSLESNQTNVASLTINSFIRWCGPQRKPSSLTPAEIARFSQQLPPTDIELPQKMDTLRAFLVYIKSSKLSTGNLAAHVKPRKCKNPRTTSANCRPSKEPVYLTPEGYDSLKEELEVLKAKKPVIIKAVQTAAADKDFRENSPLAAAKEELGHVEGRISELEETLKLAKVAQQDTGERKQVGIGNRVNLKEVTTGEKTCYTIVTTREARPFNGKISDSSPLGKALVGKSTGELIEITAPAGKICYIIESIGNTGS